MMKRLNKRIALITGVSHSRGIGAAICRKLPHERADVFFTYWNTEANWIHSFQKELEDINIRSGYIEIDLSNPSSASVIFDAIVSQFGVPTILINNAAHSTRDGYLYLDASTLDEHYKI